MLSTSSSVISLSFEANTWSAPCLIIDSTSSLASLFVFWSTKRPGKHTRGRQRKSHFPQAQWVRLQTLVGTEAQFLAKTFITIEMKFSLPVTAHIGKPLHFQRLTLVLDYLVYWYLKTRNNLGVLVYHDSLLNLETTFLSPSLAAMAWTLSLSVYTFQFIPLPCCITRLSSFSFMSAFSTILSSTVFSVIKRNTRTCFIWPIRWARS